MDKRVTYLFGAGASANALPVVSQMPARLEEYFKFLSEYQNKALTEKINGFDELLNDFKKVIVEANKHASVDTYAKKLFLKEGGNSKKLITLKYFLSGYFIFEQMGVEYKHEGPLIVSRINDTQRQDMIKAIEKTVDDRYDVFLATLLQKNQNGLRLPSNINILSWNYDHQFELAYSDFGGRNIRDIQEKFNINFEKGLDEEWAKENSQIIKLNGSALNLYQITPSKTITSVFNNFDNIQKMKIFVKLFELCQNAINSKVEKYTVPFLNFAWELDSNEFSQKAIDRAKIIMEHTEILVVIGYSFPNFNRQIDKMLLEKGKKLEKIYFQAPENYIDGLIQRLKGINTNKIIIEPYTDIGQFLIPYEL